MFLEPPWPQMTFPSWLTHYQRPMLGIESWAIKTLGWSWTTKNQVRYIIGRMRIIENNNDVDCVVFWAFYNWVTSKYFSFHLTIRCVFSSKGAHPWDRALSGPESSVPGGKHSWSRSCSSHRQSPGEQRSASGTPHFKSLALSAKETLTSTI